MSVLAPDVTDGPLSGRSHVRFRPKADIPGHRCHDVLAAAAPLASSRRWVCRGSASPSPTATPFARDLVSGDAVFAALFVEYLRRA